LVHPALGEPYTSSILQIHGRDDDHNQTPIEKCKVKNVKRKIPMADFKLCSDDSEMIIVPVL
jgi:hypothetical protein